MMADANVYGHEIMGAENEIGGGNNQVDLTHNMFVRPSA